MVFVVCVGVGVPEVVFSRITMMSMPLYLVCIRYLGRVNLEKGSARYSNTWVTRLFPNTICREEDTSDTYTEKTIHPKL